MNEALKTIAERFACRIYQNQPIELDTAAGLQASSSFE